MPYVYKMVDIPNEVDGKSLARGAEKIIETVVNNYAAKGWEFVGIEQVQFSSPAGCLFFWRQPESVFSRFIVFRALQED